MIPKSFVLGKKTGHLQELVLEDSSLAVIFTKVSANHEIKELRKKYSFLIYSPDFSQKNVETVVRTIVKKNWCDAILDVDMMPKKNSAIQYTSLLDNGLVKECAKNDVSIFVSIQSIQNPHSHETYGMRVLQSKKLCKKYGVKHVIVNISHSHVGTTDLDAFSQLLK
jgi:hypothetical protein